MTPEEHVAEEQAWLDSDEHTEIVRYLRSLVRVPFWWTVAQHALLVFMTMLMIGVSLLAYRTAESAVRVEVLMEQSVSELQTLNLFFDSALVAAQRRADDLRETQRRQLDSLRALRQR